MGICIDGGAENCSCHGRPYNPQTGYHYGTLDNHFVGRHIFPIITVLGVLIICREIATFVFSLPRSVLFNIESIFFGTLLIATGYGMKKGYVGFFKKETRSISPITAFLVVGYLSVVVGVFFLLVQ